MDIYFAGFTIKDWLIIAALVILLLLIIKVRRLRRIISEDALSRLIPEVGLIIVGDISKEFYLKNYSTTIARNIRIQDIEVDMEDFGFKIPLKVVFEGMDSLNPVDKIKLNYKIFSRGNEIVLEEQAKYVNHIVIADFDCMVHYENIQNRSFCSRVVNRQGKLSIREIILNKKS